MLPLNIVRYRVSRLLSQPPQGRLFIAYPLKPVERLSVAFGIHLICTAFRSWQMPIQRHALIRGVLLLLSGLGPNIRMRPLALCVHGRIGDHPLGQYDKQAKLATLDDL